MAVTTKRLSRKNVEDFLVEMKGILLAASFDPEKDFIFQEERAQDDPDDEFTNANTILALDYDYEDIIEELKTLTIEEYCESMVDTVSKDLSFWHIFGRKIQNRDVYIKVRIKQRKRGSRFVFCISFHFARHILADFPYRK